MFNIAAFHCNSPKDYGYDAVYSSDSVKGKIETVNSTPDAVVFKNKKTLILLKSHDFDEGSIKLIAQKKKACFLIDLSMLIRSYGTGRAILLSRLRNFLALCNKYGAYYTFADFAKSEFELRTARELMHLGLLLGLNLGQSKFALKMLKHYL